MGRKKGIASMSDERRNELKELYHELRHYALAIYDIAVESLSAEAASERYDCDIATLRRVMGIGRYDFKTNSVAISNEDYINRAFSGYEKLWLKCMGFEKYYERHRNNFDIRVVPPDCDETMKELFNTLNKKEKTICEMWCNGLTYEDIGKEFNITRTRVQQIMMKAIRKLRSQNRYKIMIHGKKFYERMIKEREKYIEDNIHAPEYLKMVDEAQSIVDDNNLEDLYELRDDINNYIDSLGGGPKKPQSITIEELADEYDHPLSVRSLNCLKRANIHTLGDLEKMTVDDLMRCRNLGQKSLEEIVTKMAEHGLKLKEEE